MKIALLTIEYGSMADDEHLREMWAGLLASACSESGEDDSNVIFTNILQQLTSVQAKILAYACEAVPKVPSTDGLVKMPQDTFNRIDYSRLVQAAGISNPTRMSIELRCLWKLGLLKHTIATAYGVHQVPSPDTNPVDIDRPVGIEPTELGFMMYVRCSGSRATSAEFFNPQPAAGQREL